MMRKWIAGWFIRTGRRIYRPTVTETQRSEFHIHFSGNPEDVRRELQRRQRLESRGWLN